MFINHQFLNGTEKFTNSSQWFTIAFVSLLIGTNCKPLAAIGKFPNAIGKLMIGKTFATNREEITIAMIGKDVLAVYW